MTELPTQYGHSGVSERHARSILTKPTGFVGAYDYTLNPYSGCAFGCTYCYAAFFARTDQQAADWGYWVEVKQNALDLLRRKRYATLAGKTIYMSSVTDPYQPIERELELTRSLLVELAERDVRLVIQTRGTLVTRDIDLLKRFGHVQVNMTVTTDDETVRKAFEPLCPSTEQRLAAITQVREAGIRAAVTMTPLLPLRDPAAFAERLRATGVTKFVVQGFHAGSARFTAGTGDKARSLAQSMKWNAARYGEAVTVLRNRLPRLEEGKAGFAPDWK